MTSKKSLASQGEREKDRKRGRWFIRKMVLSLMFVENQRHRNRKLYAVKRMTCTRMCVRFISMPHTHTRFIARQRKIANKRDAWRRKSVSRPLTINSRFDGFYKMLYPLNRQGNGSTNKTLYERVSNVLVS